MEMDADPSHAGKRARECLYYDPRLLFLRSPTDSWTATALYRRRPRCYSVVNIKLKVSLCTLLDGFFLTWSGEMLIKTGQLAKRAGILPSKVRFYVKEGILQPVDQTPGGYWSL